MDNLNSTYSITIAFAPFILLNTSIFVWDNDTSGDYPLPSSNKGEKYFWIGISFVGGLVVGFILYYIYFYLQKYLLSQIEEYPDSRQSGVVNMSFIGDDSRSSFADRPPDYATVVSGNNEGDASFNQKASRGFFKRLFKRSSGIESTGTAGDVADEPPPSYSSVVPNLEVDFSVRWQSDDGVSITMNEYPIAQSQ